MVRNLITRVDRGQPAGPPARQQPCQQSHAPAFYDQRGNEGDEMNQLLTQISDSLRSVVSSSSVNESEIVHSPRLLLHAAPP